MVGPGQLHLLLLYEPTYRCFWRMVVVLYYGVLDAKQLLIGAEIVVAFSIEAMLPSASSVATTACRRKWNDWHGN